MTIEDVNDDDVVLNSDVSDEELEEVLAKPAKPSPILSDNLSVSKHTGPPQSKKYITTRKNTTVKTANKIKDKYKKQLQRKKIGIIKTSSNTPDDDEKPNRKVTRTDNPNKAPANWLKAAGYINTKDQDSVRYVYVPPKKADENKPSGDTGHYIRSEIDNTDLKKKTDLATKIAAKNIIKKNTEI